MRRALLAAAAAAALSLAGPAAARGSEVVLGTCSWMERSDPVVANVLYPDAGAVYYAARLPAPPPGISYRIRGRFPHARYMSFVSYDGLPMDALLDADIPPDAGSTNPFVPGASRTAARRSYTVRIVGQRPPTDPARRAPGALYVGGGQLGLPAPVFYVLYRIYVPDRGAGPAGGVSPPSIEVLGPGGLRLDLRGVPCEGVRDAVSALPLPVVQDAYAEASVPVDLPALLAPAAPSWTIESGLTGALLGTAGQDGRVSGGPASNPHNRYLAASVSRAHGEVLAIRGRAPTTPATAAAEPVMGSGDLRYWSFCQNSRTTRYVACVADHEVALDGDGFYTIAISDPAHRPPSAGTWLPFGPEPEGQVLFRHMLPSAAFLPRSAQGVADSGADLRGAMGDFYPRAAYCSVARFERDACGLRPAQP